eukprot:307663-Lingulodinium_polyedra.AAC.1
MAIGLRQRGPEHCISCFRLLAGGAQGSDASDAIGMERSVVHSVLALGISDAGDHKPTTPPALPGA